MTTALLGDLHFLRPWWLLGLVVLPLLWRALRMQGADAQAWRGAVDAHLLEYLLVPGEQSAPARSPRWLALAAWTFACLALAGPAWERLPQPLYQNKAARVIAFELSETMLAQDVKPSRFARARFRIADVLKRSADMQTALIAYAGDAFVVAPLTDDANTVANLVDSLDPSVMPARGNDTGIAIDLGVKLMHQAGVRDGEIVLLADSASADANAAAARARASGVRVSVLGIGSSEGAPVPMAQGDFLKDSAGNIVLPKLDASALSDLARAGGGQYANVSSDGGVLDNVLADLKDTSNAAPTQVQTERFLDRGPWLVLLLLPLAALGFRRGWLMLVPLVFALHAPQANASVWSDLWQRPDQQAQKELDAGNAKEAQALAQNPDLRGTAAYRAGDFDAATTDFARTDEDENADADYNRGNALAKQGKYPEAIAAYDEALRRAPQMDDAVANKQAIEDWLKQQKKDKKQNQQQGQKDHQGHEQQKPGNDQSQDSNQSKDGKGDQQGDDQGEKQQSEQEGKDEKGKAQQDGKPKDSSKEGQKSSADGAAGDEQDNAEQPQNGSEADKGSQQQFEQNIDKALKADADKNKTQQPVRMGARDGKTHNEQSQAVEQWLQRVPDDPGGLLRRKFQLEYQRRHQGGGNEENSQ